MSAPAGALHVYIEGDGTPYVARHDFAADPTPRNPLMLRLMTLDPALTEAAARQLLREGGQGYDSIAAFQQALAQQGVPLPELAGLDVRSQHFRALGVLQLDGVPYAYASLIERRAGQFRVVARWRGRD